MGTNSHCPNIFRRACLEDTEAPGVDLNYSNEMRSTKYNITFTCNWRGAKHNSVAKTQCSVYLIIFCVLLNYLFNSNLIEPFSNDHFKFIKNEARPTFELVKLHLNELCSLFHFLFLPILFHSIKRTVRKAELAVQS